MFNTTSWTKSDTAAARVWTSVRSHYSLCLSCFTCFRLAKLTSFLNICTVYDETFKNAAMIFYCFYRTEITWLCTFNRNSLLLCTISVNMQIMLTNEGNWLIWVFSGRTYCISSDLLSFTVAASDLERCFDLLYMYLVLVFVMSEYWTWTTNEGSRSAHHNVNLAFPTLSGNYGIYMQWKGATKITRKFDLCTLKSSKNWNVITFMV